MKFRKGKARDLPQLVAHGEEFWKHTTYWKHGRNYSPITVCSLCDWLIQDDQGFITILADENDDVKGFGLVCVTPFIFDRSFDSALELAYYIDPEVRGKYGIALLNEMEKMAHDAGAEFISMITMEDSDPDTAARIYNKLGYEKNEVVYTKELTHG